MTELFKYKMPVGFVTNEQQLRDLQKELLKQQYQKNYNKRDKYEDQVWTKRRYSERNLHHPETTQSLQFTINNKDTEIRKLLAQDLKYQIEQNQTRKKYALQQKLQEERRAIYASKQMTQREMENNKIAREKNIKQMTKDYEEKMRRKQERNLNQLRQKQAIANRLKQIETISSPQRRPKVQNNNPEVQYSNQITNSGKIPLFYKEVSNYQIENSQQFQRNVRNSAQQQNRRLQNIIDSRIRQNQRKEQQYDKYQKMQRQIKRQQLQRVLQKQIEQSERKKQQQMAYQKSKFYGSKFQNIYNPIVNPVDSRFCKDNKYLINELYMQGQKKKSRQSQSNTDQIQSSLARKGSRSLL